MNAFVSFPAFNNRLISSFTPICHRLQSTRLKSSSYTLRRHAHICAQLIGMPEGFGKKDLDADENEILLAELRFSEPSMLPSLVQNNLDRLDEDFYTYLESQISASSDIEERNTLRTLRDAITDIMKQLLDSMAAQDNVNDVSNTTVDVNDPTDVAQATYDQLINYLINFHDPKDKKALMTAVNVSYEQIDMRLLERLQERISTKGKDFSTLNELQECINNTMNERITVAAESVKAVLATGDPTMMKKEVTALARKGKIDDAFILLLQANLQQANKAGARTAIEVLTLIIDHASSLKDVTLDPEVRLIRSLLRTEDKVARKKMLKDSLEPKKSVQTVDGDAMSSVIVDGKKFVIALRKLIEEFGNVDEKFILKLSEIGEESEAVARDIFDMEGKDVQDLQNEAFHKRSVSIWDLEKIEMEEEVRGNKALWEGKLGNIPEGFSEDGKLTI